MGDGELELISNKLTRISLLLEGRGASSTVGRDLWSAFGWPLELNRKTLNNVYRRDLGGSIVDILANQTWAKPPRISDDGRDDTPFMNEWNQLVETHEIWGVLCDLDLETQKGQFAILYFNWKKTLDERASSAIGGSLKLDDLVELVVYPENDGSVRHGVSIAEWDTNELSERYAKPLRYRAVLSDGEVRGGHAAFQPGALTIHADRTLHVAQNATSGSCFGFSSLERPFNTLLDIEKLSAVNELAWMLAQLFIKIDEKMKAPSGISKEQFMQYVSDQFEELSKGFRKNLVGKGYSVEALSRDLPDPKGAWDMNKSKLSAASQIPPQFIFGTESNQPMGAAQQAFSMRIARRQKRFAESKILRPLINYFIRVGVLPPPKKLMIGEGQRGAWPPIFEPSLSENASTGEAKSRSYSNYVSSGMNEEEARQCAGLNFD